MVFSSPIFLFAFLPLTLGLYYVARPAWRNSVLLLLSLFFYAWGETVYVLVMLGSIGINYITGKFLDKKAEERVRRRILAAGITINLLTLIFFKYAGFIAFNISRLWVSGPNDFVPLQSVHLPIGISFFTFQAMSYLIDIYRGTAGGAGRFIDCALYISLFPQLIAGPIVRYHHIAGQMRSRLITGIGFSQGVQRFIMGLAKKVLLADNAGFITDTIFTVPGESLTPSMAWLGLIAYTMQIYFDFSGYSDMAIGLGRMVGFEFQENFNFPYISRSIREFWRRWHISLSTWFRDYLYLPLGGSHKGSWRTYFNLWVVFLLCGLWHGAAWNFVVWGMLHGVYLVVERLGWDRILNRLWRPVQHLYTMALVMIGWVFFRADNLADALHYLTRLAGRGYGAPIHFSALAAFDPGRLMLLAIAGVLCMPVGHILVRAVRRYADECDGWKPRLTELAFYVFLMALFILTLADVASNTYHPFIYFRF